MIHIPTNLQGNHTAPPGLIKLSSHTHTHTHLKIVGARGQGTQLQGPLHVMVHVNYVITQCVGQRRTSHVLPSSNMQGKERAFQFLYPSRTSHVLPFCNMQGNTTACVEKHAFLCATCKAKNMPFNFLALTERATHFL